MGLHLKTPNEMEGLWVVSNQFHALHAEVIAKLGTLSILGIA